MHSFAHNSSRQQQFYFPFLFIFIFALANCMQLNEEKRKSRFFPHNINMYYDDTQFLLACGRGVGERKERFMLKFVDSYELLFTNSFYTLSFVVGEAFGGGNEAFLSLTAKKNRNGKRRRFITPFFMISLFIVCWCFFIPGRMVICNFWARHFALFVCSM